MRNPTKVLTIVAVGVKSSAVRFTKFSQKIS